MTSYPVKRPSGHMGSLNMRVFLRPPEEEVSGEVWGKMSGEVGMTCGEW